MKKSLNSTHLKLNNKNCENELLDKMDRKILNILQRDNQITNQALAKKIGISAPPCFMRIPEDLITNSGRHLIADSGVFDHFNDSRCGLSFKEV